MTPAVVIAPMRGARYSANQIRPSGPDARPCGYEVAVASGNSVVFPSSVMRPIAFPLMSVNQRLPSGPVVMSSGAPTPPGRSGRTIGKSVIRFTAPPATVHTPGPRVCPTCGGIGGDDVVILRGAPDGVPLATVRYPCYKSHKSLSVRMSSPPCSFACRSRGRRLMIGMLEASGRRRLRRKRAGEMTHG